MAKSAGKGLNNPVERANILTAENVVPVPANVLLKPEAMEFWHTYTTARIATEWREFDLILIAKLCNLEADIRATQKMLDASAPVVLNDKGNPIVNPLIRILDIYGRQQLMLTRSLSLNIPAIDPRTMAGHGIANRKHKALIANDKDGLLARKR